MLNPPHQMQSILPFITYSSTLDTSCPPCSSVPPLLLPHLLLSVNPPVLVSHALMPSSPCDPPPHLWSCSSVAPFMMLARAWVSLRVCCHYRTCVVPVNVFIICCISVAVHPVANSPIIIWLIALVQRPPIQSQMTFLWHFRSVLKVHCVRFSNILFFVGLLIYCKFQLHNTNICVFVHFKLGSEQTHLCCDLETSIWVSSMGASILLQYVSMIFNT